MEVYECALCKRKLTEEVREITKMQLCFINERAVVHSDFAPSPSRRNVVLRVMNYVLTEISTKNLQKLVKKRCDQ